MGVWGAGRKYRGRHSGNSVSVGRWHDCAVCDCVLGLWEVDRSERLAIRCEEGDAGAHVHGWRRVLPVSRYVLWGYQFKSVAALGPILGPFIGITFGWIPALIWI